MKVTLLNSTEAAQQLGVTTPTLYGWLGLSRRGLLMLRGQRVTIDYLQGGAQGQGRIRIEADEVERIKSLLRVQSQEVVERQPRVAIKQFPGIVVPLGRPGRP